VAAEPLPDPDILLNKNRMPERFALARDNKLPTEVMMDISRTCGDRRDDHRSAAGTQCQSEAGDHRGTAGNELID
jgi:hypothetical protein